MATNEQPKKLGLIGTTFAVVVGGAIYHWWSHGANAVEAMKAVPTSGSTGLGALIGGLAALSLPQMPVVGGFVTGFIDRIKSMIGIGAKIVDSVPPQLISDIAAILSRSNGAVTLDDIQKLIVDFSQIHPVAIFDLLRQMVNAFRDGGNAVKLLHGEVPAESSSIEVKI